MKIASWNVNSIKQRIDHVLRWLKDADPDVLLLQELKCIDDNFPRLEIEDAGYNAAVHGQKAFNGVAILSKHPIEDVKRGLPGDSKDEQARYIEATVNGIRVASIYLPNGNPAPGEKFDYKLRWMDRLIVHARELLATERPFVLGGDYNVCPKDEDVYDPEGWAEDALCRPESRAKFRALQNLGLYDAFRAIVPSGPYYTYWDYKGGAWNKDHGLRIDHLLLSPQAADRLVTCEIDKRPRGWEKASDHTPIWCSLKAAD
ncbi:MAG: exodeoxyribonuclease III [Alphaproteobacteria bacterium]|nr:MAG: exodeoxyribonuclease III [Alphaproteobacteria bacterium]